MGFKKAGLLHVSPTEYDHQYLRTFSQQNPLPPKPVNLKDIAPIYPKTTKKILPKRSKQALVFQNRD